MWKGVPKIWRKKRKFTQFFLVRLNYLTKKKEWAWSDCVMNKQFKQVQANDNRRRSQNLISKATFPRKKENIYRYLSFGLKKPANEILDLRGQNILSVKGCKTCKSNWLIHERWLDAIKVSFWFLRSTVQTPRITHLSRLKNLMQQNVWSNNFKKVGQTVQK